MKTPKISIEYSHGRLKMCVNGETLTIETESQSEESIMQLAGVLKSCYELGASEAKQEIKYLLGNLTDKAIMAAGEKKKAKKTRRVYKKRKASSRKRYSVD